MIRVVLPPHLRTLAQTGKEVELQVEGPVTQRSVLDALEAAYPVLRGTIRDQVTAAAPAVHAILRRRAGPVPSTAGCPAARSGRAGCGALLDRGGHCRRLAYEITRSFPGPTVTGAGFFCVWVPKCPRYEPQGARTTLIG